MGMDSTISIDAEHIHNIQVVAKDLGDKITDGASAVEDESGELITSGTDAIKSTVENVARVVSSLNNYLNQVATSFHHADASISELISKGRVVTSYGNPNYSDPNSPAPATDGEKKATSDLPC